MPVGFLKMLFLLPQSKTYIGGNLESLIKLMCMSVLANGVCPGVSCPMTGIDFITITSLDRTKLWLTEEKIRIIRY